MRSRPSAPDDRAVRTGCTSSCGRELVRPSRLSSRRGTGGVRLRARPRPRRRVRAGSAGRARTQAPAAAGWIEQPRRSVTDYAELLAHHYREALALARAAGVETSEHERPGAALLVLAAEHASSVDIGARGRALPAGARADAAGTSATRPRLTAFAEFAEVGSDRRQVDAILDEAHAELPRPTTSSVGKVLLVESSQAWSRRTASAMEHCLDAVAAARAAPTGTGARSRVRARRRSTAISGDAEGALEWARGLRVAEQLGSEQLSTRTAVPGDRTLRPRRLRRARRPARRPAGVVEHGWTREAGIGFNNYGSWVWLIVGADEALAIYREGIDFARAARASGSRSGPPRRAHGRLFDAGGGTSCSASGRSDRGGRQRGGHGHHS